VIACASNAPIMPACPLAQDVTLSAAHAKTCNIMVIAAAASVRHSCHVLSRPAICDVRRWGEAVSSANDDLFSCGQATNASGISTSSISDSCCLPSQKPTSSAMHAVDCGAGELAVTWLHRLLGAPRLTLPGRRRHRVPLIPQWCKPRALLVLPHAEGERNGAAGDDSWQDVDSCAPEFLVTFPPRPSQPPVMCPVTCAFRMRVPKPGQCRGEIPGPHLLALGGPLGGKSERRDASCCAACSAALRALPSASVEGSTAASPAKIGSDAKRCGDIPKDLCDGEDLPSLP